MSKNKGTKEGEPSKWGRGRTDPETWFKPGGKGGPGRPKGSKNRKTHWQEASARTVSVPRNGKQKKTSVGALKYDQLATKAANGDLKAIAKAIELDERWAVVEPMEPTAEQHAANLATLDYMINLRSKFAKGGEAAS